MITTQIHQEILVKMSSFSEQQLDQVLQFINSLSQPPTKSIDDPLADFIGIVDHGDLAQNIDRELYE